MKKPRNPHAVAAHQRSAGPHDQPDKAPPIERPTYSFHEWAHEIYERLQAGREEYGDGSFFLGAEALICELEEEARDLAGWGYVLWHVLQGVDREDTLRQAPTYLKAAGYGSVWPPPESTSLHVTAVWLGALSRAVLVHLDRIRKAHGL